MAQKLTLLTPHWEADHAYVKSNLPPNICISNKLMYSKIQIKFLFFNKPQLEGNLSNNLVHSKLTSHMSSPEIIESETKNSSLTLINSAE